MSPTPPQPSPATPHPPAPPSDQLPHPTSPASSPPPPPPPPPIDPLDDVFGSAPPSPTPTTTDSTRLHLRPPHSDHSDIPRLRHVHVTSGYRDGMAAGKTQQVQGGFDEGFRLGGAIGMAVGVWLGWLEGAAKAMGAGRRGGGGGGDGSVQRAWEAAREEMRMERMLGEEYFGADGVWKYEVPGREGDGEGEGEGEDGTVTLGHVARWHPVVRKWREVVGGLSREYGIVALVGEG